MTLLVFTVVVYLTVTVKASVNCPEEAKAGNCDFYTKCVEPRFQCGTNGYSIAYGERYCLRFTEGQDDFTTTVRF